MYDYVAKKVVKPAKKLVCDLLRDVHKSIKKDYHLTFDQVFIGSGKRNLVLSDNGGKDPFDLDINLIVNIKGELPKPKTIRENFTKAIEKSFKGYGFSECRKSNRVLTVTHSNDKGVKDFSVDFAIYSNEKSVAMGRYQIALLEDDGQYNWGDVTPGYKNQKEYEKYCKKHKLWPQVRESYKKKKNNDTENKDSRSLYQETLKEVVEKDKAKNLRRNK